MNELTITSAKYLADEVHGNVGITLIVDNGTESGQRLGVPLDPANRHYAEIMRQVAAGDLTIADAD